MIFKSYEGRHNVKRILQSVLVFWGIITLFPLFYVAYSFIVYKISPVGDEMISMTTWLDANANGIRERGEPALPGVCVWYSFRPDGPNDPNPCQFEDDPVTDENGQRKDFLPAWYCDMIYSFAITPEGYQPTTDLGKKGCPIEFGFVQKDVPVRQKVRSIDEFIRYTILMTQIQRIGTGTLILVTAIAGTYWLMRRDPSKHVSG